MQLEDLLKSNLIKIGLEGDNKFQVIEELIDMISDAGLLKDKSVALEDVLEREKYLSTGLEFGIAIPHGKSEAINELCIAFGVSEKGVDFDSLDGAPASLIFLVLSPKDTSGPHIQFLAKISRNLRKKEIREKLHSCKSKEEIAQIFESFS